MFTRQANLISKLSSYLDPQAVQVLQGILADCEQQLEHRGETWINLGSHLTESALSQPAAPAVPNQKPVAAFAVANHNSRWSPGNSRVTGGWSGHFTGATYIENLVAGNIYSDSLAGDTSAVAVTASSNWTYSGTLPSRGGGIAAVQATKSDGTSVLVYLPVARGQDPNVVSGQSFYASPVGGSSVILVATGMGDDAVGTWKMTSANNAEIPAGWQLVPGALNEDGAFVRGTNRDSGGGSGSPTPFDWSVRPAASVSGGKEFTLKGVDVNLIASRINDHPITETSYVSTGISIAPHSATTDPSPSGITIPPHPPHSHVVSPHYVQHCHSSGGYDYDYGSGYGYDGDYCGIIFSSSGPNIQQLTHDVEEPNLGEGTGHRHTISGMEHKITENGHAHLVLGHSHRGSGKMEDQQIPMHPLAISVKFIERIDNSA